MKRRKNTKYVIITPVRNEEKYIETTIKSIISQTIKPLEWVIVNDGSTDNTGKIIDSFARQLGWISTLHRIDRGFRKSGGGVIESFYEGFNSLKADQYEFVIKLDGDLSFDPDYFERCFEYFNRIPHMDHLIIHRLILLLVLLQKHLKYRLMFQIIESLEIESLDLLQK